jgi:hypothetical protein
MREERRDRLSVDGPGVGWAGVLVEFVMCQRSPLHGPQQSLVAVKQLPRSREAVASVVAWRDGPWSRS